MAREVNTNCIEEEEEEKEKEEVERKFPCSLGCHKTYETREALYIHQVCYKHKKNKTLTI